MNIVFNSDNQKNVCFKFKVKTKNLEGICFRAKDMDNKYSYYANHTVPVKGYRECYIKLPITPKRLEIQIFNKKNGNLPKGKDRSFEFESSIEKLKTFDYWCSDDEKEFFDFALEFSVKCGNLKSSINNEEEENKYIYFSKNKKFKISYYDDITMFNQVLNTPSRIWHNDGIIDVAKNKFLEYTIPQRLIVLLHEYSHKYNNPLINHDISYEVGADINALYMYLAYGFSELEALVSWLYIFDGNYNSYNEHRYNIIRYFTEEFLKGKINKFSNYDDNMALKLE